jgi:hypothetical protein
MTPEVNESDAPNQRTKTTGVPPKAALPSARTAYAATLPGRIYTMLRTIADETYPNRIGRFSLDMLPDEFASKHGDYNQATKKIRIMNLSRGEGTILVTTIHELAHHCEVFNTGKTGHGETFYLTMRDLMITAMRHGWVVPEDLQELAGGSAPSNRAFVRKFGDDLRQIKSSTTGSRTSIVKVFDAFAIKDALKAAGYGWSKLELCWTKEVHADQIEQEMRFVAACGQARVVVQDARRATMDVVFHAVVRNGVEQREKLKAAGYRFKGYGYTSPVWVKRISAEERDAEARFLKSIGCMSVKFEGKQ